MNAKRQKKLIMISFMLLVLALFTALVLYALRQNISLFYTPSQLFKGEAPLAANIRLGGFVEAGSLVHEKGNLMVHFRLTDHHHSIAVNYKGILPDLFREGQGVVTKGKLLGNKVFLASDVLAKHDENYMPPELKSTRMDS